MSFVPDGTNLGGSYSSNLLTTFNARWPTAVWQNQILLAAQTWAQYTNLNFAIVPDDGRPFGAGDYQQGDPAIGDIRIAGFNFGTDDLAAAWYPPPGNNYSVAGDVFFNTTQPFNMGSTYDLFTVAVHELGHALGLLHSTDYYAAMYPTYVGAKGPNLEADDIAGIRNLYSADGARSPDGFGYYTNRFQTAADLTGAFDAISQTFVGTQLDITYPGQAEYYRFQAPPGTSTQLSVTIQSSGLSLLSPFVALYDANQRPIATASGYGHDGTTVSVTVGGVVPGQLFWLRVSGADNSPFGIGRYALIVNFGRGASPSVAPVDTATLDGNPVLAIGGDPDLTAAMPAEDGDVPTLPGSTGEVIYAAHDGPLAELSGDRLSSVIHPSSVVAELVLVGQAPTTLRALPVPMDDPPVNSSVVLRTPGFLPAPLLETRMAQSTMMSLQTARRSSEQACTDEGEAPSATLPDSSAVPAPPEPAAAPRTTAALAGPDEDWRAACTAWFTVDFAAPGLPPSSRGLGFPVAFPSALPAGAALAGFAAALGTPWRSAPEPFIRRRYLPDGKWRPGRSD